jgi:hypothetical protein
MSFEEFRYVGDESTLNFTVGLLTEDLNLVNYVKIHVLYNVHSIVF